MNYLKVIKTEIGQIWLLRASENGIDPLDGEGKTGYQRRVTDLMIQDVLGDYRIVRAENGAPEIEGEKDIYVSISHSEDYFTVYISRKQHVGVDVEICNRSLERGRHYFLNESEMQKSWTNDELYAIWGMKEALFKQMRGEIDDLNASVTTIELNECAAKAIFKGKEYSFGIERFDKEIVVYSILDLTS